MGQVVPVISTPYAPVAVAVRVRMAVSVEPAGVRLVLLSDALRPGPVREKTDVFSLIDPENPSLLVAVIVDVVVAPVVR